MNILSIHGEIIEKEKISKLTFPAKEVLSGEKEVRNRNARIRQARGLGHSAGLKVKIVFEDDQSKKMVETTIWGISGNDVILKNGITIPADRIHDINFF